MDPTATKQFGINGTPTIQTARLTLRPYRLDDLDSLFRILSVPGMLRYYPNPQPITKEKVTSMINHQLEHWQTYNYGYWALEPQVSKELIGWCGLEFVPETGETEVAYLLSKSYWGKGLATEAARAVLRFGFENTSLNFIIGLVHPENIASQKVITKIGLNYLKSARYFGADLYLYRIDRDSFSPREEFYKIVYPEG